MKQFSFSKSFFSFSFLFVFNGMVLFLPVANVCEALNDKDVASVKLRDVEDRNLSPF